MKAQIPINLYLLSTAKTKDALPSVPKARSRFNRRIRTGSSPLACGMVAHTQVATFIGKPNWTQFPGPLRTTESFIRICRVCLQPKSLILKPRTPNAIWLWTFLSAETWGSVYLVAAGLQPSLPAYDLHRLAQSRQLL